MLGPAEKILVRLDRQIYGFVIVLSTGQARGVVGEIRLCQLVERESPGHLLPPRHALSGIGFGERPQVPRSPVFRIGRDRPRREIAHTSGPAPISQ